jgi:hypothetical protein
MTVHFLRPGALRPYAAALALPLLLAACSGKTEPPPCPPVYILSDAKDVTKYRPGPGQDLTDVLVHAEIVGFHGNCAYEAVDKGFNVKLDLQVAIEAKRGPANTARKADLVYFVAIPHFYPSEQAKAVFPISIQFPEGTDTVRTVDEPVDLTIPIGAKDVVDKYEVYLGFQTTPDELEHNRKEK